MNRVDRRQYRSPRHALPCRTRADEGDHGAAGLTGASRYQLECRVRDDNALIAALRRNLVDLPRIAQTTPLHRSVKPVPMQASQHRWDHDVQAATEHLVRRVPRKLGDRVIPFPDDSVAVNRDSRPLPFANPLHSVHILYTVHGSGQFT